MFMDGQDAADVAFRLYSNVLVHWLFIAQGHSIN